MPIIKTPEAQTYIPGRILLLPPYIPPPAEAQLGVRIDYCTNYLYEIFNNLFRVELALTQLMDLADRQGTQLENIPEQIANTAQNTLAQLQPLLTGQNTEKSDIDMLNLRSPDFPGQSSEQIFAEDIQQLLSIMQADSAAIQELTSEISRIRENVDFILSNTPDEIQTRIDTAVDKLRTELIVKFS